MKATQNTCHIADPGVSSAGSYHPQRTAQSSAANTRAEPSRIAKPATPRWARLKLRFESVIRRAIVNISSLILCSTRKQREALCLDLDLPDADDMVAFP